MKNRFRPCWKKWGSAILAAALAAIMAQGVQANGRTLMMATTTSTDNTGLLDYLIPHFEAHTGITLKWTSTGTGKALALGQNCDVDVLLVHAPAAEESFIRKGYGKDRRQIMNNDFVIIGPDADPAGINTRQISEALAAIKNAGVFFMSRGDDSGTNKKEQLLWKNAGIPLPDKESWYIQTGQGMLATITMTRERNGYTMTDRGTYIKYRHQQGDKAPLKILVEGDDILLNQYSVVTVNPVNCPGAEYDLALVFSDWMASSHARELINNFRLLGQPLFIPNAEK